MLNSLYQIRLLKCRGVGAKNDSKVIPKFPKNVIVTSSTTNFLNLTSSHKRGGHIRDFKPLYASLAQKRLTGEGLKI